jgi:hypothetical protein
MGMPKWEYLTIVDNGPGKAFSVGSVATPAVNVEALLNDKGAEEWELVTALTSNTTRAFFLKRPAD